MKYPIFIDLEASGLHPDSYPIEVAWNNRKGEIESHLIIPADDWVHWDFNAQQMHGISRSMLFDEGKPISWIAARMSELFGREKVYSDASSFDAAWVDMLYEEADRERKFIVADYQYFIYHLGFQSVWPTLSHDSWKSLKCQRHRAACDVEHHMVAFKMMKSRPKPDKQSRITDWFSDM